MSTDVIGAGDRWLPAETYARMRELMPILCVDVLLSPLGEPGVVGLIWREDGGSRGWCLVGGRVLRGEPLAEAAVRHVAATLGPEVRIDLPTLTLRTVAEYFPVPRPGALHDPLKHAVALTYTAACDGPLEAMGEALEFRWFSLDALGALEFAFGHGSVIAITLAASMPGALPAAVQKALSAP